MPFAYVLGLLGVFAFNLASAASDVSRDDLDAWLKQTIVIDPPMAGSVIDFEHLDTLKPWIPPGVTDEFEFPEVRVEIQATLDYPGHHTYVEASKRFRGQATLGPGNELENYTAGLPFDFEQIGAAEPAVAGVMMAWNQIHRWQYTGYQVDEMTMTYIDSQPGNGPLDPDHGLMGGGTSTRKLTQSYHRVYLNNLAWLDEQNYRFDVPGSDTNFFKDHIAFLAPFDVKGTMFVVERNLDPHADDQVNIYSPTERRVRRFSAKERADSFMGSTGTMDDFEGFSGRVLDYTWTYLGRRELMYVADSQHFVSQGFGPYSRLPDDRWQIRDCYVVEAKSIWDGHPYGSRVLFIDAQTLGAVFSMVFDHDGMLWKTFLTIYRGPAPQDTREAPLHTSVPSWRGQFNIDRKSNTSTVVQGITDTFHPTIEPSQIKRIFSVSNLTSGR